MPTENVAVAPEKEKAKKPKSTAFGTKKEPDQVIFRLIVENDRSERPDTPRFPPYKIFPNTDIISWEFKDDKGQPYMGERAIRYLPGYSSIFVDEQEADGRVIPAATLNNPNNRIEVIDGDIKCRPNQKTKIQFLELCNRHIDSPNRTGVVMPWYFEKYSDEKFKAKLALFQRTQQEALRRAFASDEDLVAKLAPIMEIPMIDENQGSRTYDSVKTDYIQFATDRPAKFLEIYDENS